MNWEEIKKLHHLLGNGDNFKQTKEGGWVENTCTISGDARISFFISGSILFPP